MRLRVRISPQAVTRGGGAEEARGGLRLLEHLHLLTVPAMRRNRAVSNPNAGKASEAEREDGMP